MKQQSVAVSDEEFVEILRDSVTHYLAAVDAWEEAYHKYYRMPGSEKVSADLEPVQREYEVQRRELEDKLPRVRRLCLKHEIRDPFPGLLRISLGRHAPQHRVDPAIGRNERNSVVDDLIHLAAACRDWQADPAPSTPEPVKRSLLGRLIGYFY